MQQFEPQPEKARKWFEHGRAAADTSNHEYALWCFASAVKLDPEIMAVHEAMYESALRFASKGGKPARGGDVRKLDGPNPADRFAASEFAWMRSLKDSGLAMRLLDASVKAEQFEFGRWLAPKLLNLLRMQKKPSKSDYVKAMQLLGQVGAWEQAIQSGEHAVAIDSSDANLQNELKNLAAQRAMDQGGYEAAGGAEGGFRKFVRDADKQRELEEEEALSGGASIDERNLARAKKEYEERPTFPDAINRYAQLVKKQATTEAENLAHDIYVKGYQDTGEYRFRMAAGDIRITQADRRARELAETAERSPHDAELQDAADAARKASLHLRLTEYNERAAKYPTDRKIRFQLGEVAMEVGDFEEAMACFQVAKDEPKLRVPSGHLLGRCFAHESMHDVAISEYKEAIDRIDSTERDRELDIRYDLMVSQIEQARVERSLDLAKEALEICSGIARKDIRFRDILKKRKEVDALIKDLGQA